MIRDRRCIGMHREDHLHHELSTLSSSTKATWNIEVSLSRSQPTARKSPMAADGDPPYILTCKWKWMSHTPCQLTRLDTAKHSCPILFWLMHALRLRRTWRSRSFAPTCCAVSCNGRPESSTFCMGVDTFASSDSAITPSKPKSNTSAFRLLEMCRKMQRGSCRRMTATRRSSGESHHFSM